MKVKHKSAHTAKYLCVIWNKNYAYQVEENILNLIEDPMPVWSSFSLLFSGSRFSPNSKIFSSAAHIVYIC